MPNSSRPRGARPFGKVLRLSPYVAGGTVFAGDFVKQDSSGNIVTVANDGSEVVGQLIGVSSQSAVSGDELKVWDHPDQMFVVMASGADIDAQTDLGLNYSITATAGDTTYGVSRHRIKSDSGATTATLPLKPLRIEARIDNALGATVDCVCAINNHGLKGGTGTTGV